MSSPTHLAHDSRCLPASPRPRRASFSVIGLLAAAAVMTGCATSGVIRDAQRAEREQDFDRAVLEYSKALKAKPDDRTLQVSLYRTKLRAAEAHHLAGRRHASIGKFEEALVEYQLAAELNPGNREIDEDLRTTRTALRNKIAVAREGKTRLETLIEHAREQAVPGLELPRDVKLPSSLVFRDASSRDVITAIARFAGINVVFDPAFRDAPITVDLRDSTLDEALAAVTGATRTFYRITAPRTVALVPDTPAKRREYEEEVVRTFFISNAELKETIDLLRIVLDLRRLAALPGTNAITIKDTPERLAAAARVIAAIDKARPEVVIDVELLEVDRTRMREFGLQIASPGSPGIDGTVSVQRPGMTLENLLNLTQSDVFLTGLPALFYRALKTDSNTRILANPQLRTLEGMAAQARFGERVPVPVTTFTPIASGGVAQQPITSFNYENIGVNIDILPRMHHDDQVSLTLKVEVSNISGEGYGGLPTFGNRAISTVIRLQDGETNILAGLIRDNERRTLNGVPGLSDLPLIGRLFAQNVTESQETDIVLTLTPHIVRVLDLTESDLRPFRVGRGSTVTPSLEAPVLLETPPRDTPPGQEQTAPPDAPPAPPGPVQPIRPPQQPAPQQPPPQ